VFKAGAFRMEDDGRRDVVVIEEREDTGKLIVCVAVLALLCIMGEGVCVEELVGVPVGVGEEEEDTEGVCVGVVLSVVVCVGVGVTVAVVVVDGVGVAC